MGQRSSAHPMGDPAVQSARAVRNRVCFLTRRRPHQCPHLTAIIDLEQRRKLRITKTAEREDQQKTEGWRRSGGEDGGASGTGTSSPHRRSPSPFQSSASCAPPGTWQPAPSSAPSSDTVFFTPSFSPLFLYLSCFLWRR
jgi:hypothetical protein